MYTLLKTTFKNNDMKYFLEVHNKKLKSSSSISI